MKSVLRRAALWTGWIAISSWSSLVAAPSVRFLEPQPFAPVSQYQKFELDFAVENTLASNLQWPYDANPPSGVPAGVGISVDGVFTDPQGREYRQPAFLYQPFLDEVRNDREWHYPTGRYFWKVRFTPNQAGDWHGRIVVEDRGGIAQSQSFPFRVMPSSAHGFVRVSRRDSRYFEFDDGSFFSGLGVNLEPSWREPGKQGQQEFETLAADGITFVRMWISSVFGSAWTPYIGGRNRYGGYLPLTGLVPVKDPETGEESLAMRLDFEKAGDKGWFDACRLGWSTVSEAVKPQTNYRVTVRYRGIGIEGPRLPGREYGLVVKFGGWFPKCYESGTSRPVTDYGRDNITWGSVTGTWNSGRRNFLPRMYLALENVRSGAALVKEVSLREVLGGGRLGPEIMTKPSMDMESYIPQKSAYSLDKIVRAAEEHGIYLKLVVLEKGDVIYQKLGDDGAFVQGGDNRDGFYGVGRFVNRTRWLQQTWWRYLQARWGYSPAVHSWELTNEGDPSSTAHYEMADEFGKYMHCRVFGVEPGEGDGAACSYAHPDSHLVTTSFWHSFPAEDFWANPRYPNIDYADLHAYVSTSRAPLEERRRMARDAAYYHLWHSRSVSDQAIGKPVVRGEAGLDLPSRQDEHALGLSRDRAGLWLHNFLWSTLDSGGLYELYWWKSHLDDGSTDHRPMFSSVRAFLSRLDLQAGGYVDWGGSAGDPGLRVIGQKNLRKGWMYLWIQNRQHTWHATTQRQPLPAVSARITVPGFAPAGDYRIEWWNTYDAAGHPASVQQLSADSSGMLSLEVEGLEADVAVLIRKEEDRDRGELPESEKR